MPEELVVTGNNLIIGAGDAAARIEDLTDFESHQVVDRVPHTHEYTLWNNTENEIIVNTMEVLSVSGNPSVFSVTPSPT